MRVYIQSRTRFWNAQGNDGSSSTDLPIGATVDHSSMQAGVRGILEAQMASEKAEAARALRPEERVDWTLAYMEKVHPGISENFEGGFSISWDEDPWSLGAWAYYAPAEMLRMFPQVAIPEGRIRFAGEHTSALAATIEGAMYSALRAVREVAAAASLE